MNQNIDEPYIPKLDKRPKYTISQRLRLLSIEMRVIAKDMISGAQDSQWLDHARELEGAAEKCREWSFYIDADKVLRK